MSGTNTEALAFDLEHGTRKVSAATLPPVSIRALLGRGLGHFMTSEQASKVNSKREKVAEEIKKANPNRAVTKADMRPGGWLRIECDKAYPKAESDADLLAFQGEAWDALIAGTIGMGSRGPKITPIEACIREVAAGRVIARLKVMKMISEGATTVPKEVTFPDGSVLSRADLIKRQIDRDPEGVEKEAQTLLRQREREAARAMEKAKAEAGSVPSGAGAEAMGL